MTDLDHLTQSLARNLHRYRAEAGLTLEALAARSGVSRGMIIQIEQARTNPSVATTFKLADALGVSLTALLDYETGPQVRVLAPGKQVQTWATDKGSSSRLLIDAQAPGPFELWQWRLAPGDASASDPHPSGTVELLHVTAGELTLVVDDAPHAVPAGHSASFEGSRPHTYRNDGDQPVDMTLAVSIPAVR
ncbi:helix-turn-helix domain-containing protein [Streptomyces boninensis]|uniref:helix-turn-helix domain-containing protein n=1 Tax=Streptomyces boninensis TaxID=2039455 RepID=UPI003B225BD9